MNKCLEASRYFLWKGISKFIDFKWYFLHCVKSYLDSTTFQIPDSFMEDDLGAGGCGQYSRCQNPLEYELHSGQFLNLQVEPRKNNDKTFGTACLDPLQPSDLCIRDLGYFSLEDLDQMDQRGAFY